MMFRSQGSFQELLKKDIHDVNVQFNLRLAFKIQKFFIGKAKRKDDSEMDHLFCTKITRSLSTMDKEI